MSDSTPQGTPRRARKRVAKGSAAQPPQPPEPAAVEATSDVAAEASPEPEPTGPDPTDLSALWAPQPLVATTTTMMEVRASTRPPKDKFIRVLPFETGDGGDVAAYRNCRPVYLFEYQFDGDLSAKSFYVRPGTEVANLLAEKERLSSALLVLGMVRHGSPFIWELKLPSGRNESADKWAKSRLQLAKIAETKWLKPVANVGAGGYDYAEPLADFDPPDWSKVDYDRAVEVACRDRIIADLDHDAVREAMGL